MHLRVKAVKLALTPSTKQKVSASVFIGIFSAPKRVKIRFVFYGPELQNVSSLESCLQTLYIFS